MNISDKDASPKMNRAQAKLFWKHLTPEQRVNFNKMMYEMEQKKLQLTHVNVTTDEKIVNIVLDHKDKPGKSPDPFYSHFPKIIVPPER